MQLKMSPYFAHLVKSSLYGSDIVKVLINQDQTETILKTHNEVYSYFQNSEFKSEVNFDIKSIPILNNTLINQFIQNLPKDTKLNKIENFYKVSDIDKLISLFEKTNSIVSDLENIETEYKTFDDIDDSQVEPYHSDVESTSSFDMIDTEENKDESISSKLIKMVSKTLANAVGFSNDTESTELRNKITPLFGAINELISSNTAVSSLIDPDLTAIMNSTIKPMNDPMNEFMKDPMNDPMNELIYEGKDKAKSEWKFDNPMMSNFSGDPDNWKEYSKLEPEPSPDWMKSHYEGQGGYQGSDMVDRLEKRREESDIINNTDYKESYNCNVEGVESQTYMRHGYKYLSYAPFPDDNEKVYNQYPYACFSEGYIPTVYTSNPSKEYQICLVKFMVDNRYLVLMSNDISEYISKSEWFPELQFETVYLIPDRDEVHDLLKIQMKLVGNQLTGSAQLEEIISKIKIFLGESGTSNIIQIDGRQLNKDKTDRLIIKFINDKCIKTPKDTGKTTSSISLRDAFDDYINLIDMSLHNMITFTDLKQWLTKYNYTHNTTGDYFLQLKNVKKFDFKNGLNIPSDMICNARKTCDIRQNIILGNSSKIFQI